MKLSDEIRAALTDISMARQRYEDDPNEVAEYDNCVERLHERAEDWLHRSLAVIESAERLHVAVAELKRIETEFSRTGIRPEWDAAYDEMFNANEALKKALEEDAK